jgi:hypothetical protein
MIAPLVLVLVLLLATDTEDDDDARTLSSMLLSSLFLVKAHAATRFFSLLLLSL